MKGFGFNKLDEATTLVVIFLAELLASASVRTAEDLSSEEYETIDNDTYLMSDMTEFNSLYKAEKGFKLRLDLRGQNNKLVQAIRKSHENLIDVGCYDVWANNDYTSNLQTKFDDTWNNVDCWKYCTTTNKPIVALIRGGQCHCRSLRNFQLVRVDEKYCDIDCREIKSQKVSHGSWYRCGGNLAYSAYCDGTQNLCLTLYNNYPNTKIYRRVYSSDESDGIVEKGVFKEVSPVYSCAKCREHPVGETKNSECSLNSLYLWPAHDYFPNNSPESCVEFCRITIAYKATNNPEETRFRHPTKYAVLKWWKQGSFNLPVCMCLNSTSGYTPKDDDSCHAVCPGSKESKSCGSKLDPSIQTVYCAQKNNLCSPNDSTITTTTSSEFSTPKSQPTVSPSSILPTESTNHSTDVTESSTIIQSSPLTTNADSITTEHITPEDPSVPSTRPAPSTEKPFTTTSGPCVLECLQIFRQELWRACPGEIAYKFCIKNDPFSGNKTWECSNYGTFLGKAPDHINCASEWLNLIDRKINETDFEKEGAGKKLLLGIKASVDRASNYFGHEIRSVGYSVETIVQKVRNVSLDEQELKDMVAIVMDIVDTLLTHQEPWKELSQKDRSGISTELINNLKESVFYWTAMADAKADSMITHKSYGMDGDGDKFFMSAGAVYDPRNSNFSVRFPLDDPKPQSYIYAEIPNNISLGKLSMVGLEINNKFVVDIMPGTTDPLLNKINDGKLEENVSATKIRKILNSNLLSLSVRSSQGGFYSTISENISVTVQLKNEIEAIGKKQVRYRRFLHDNEVPKAVAGSALCVFWDEILKNWSTDGCTRLEASSKKTVCHCNHLTSFAILMELHEYIGKDPWLELLTLVLCPISSVFLLLGIILLIKFDATRKHRVIVTLNLCVCLLIGNILVVFVVDRNYLFLSEVACMIFGIITHYIFLAAVIWMLLEGLVLYRMIIIVLDAEYLPRRLCGMIAYGLPAAIVGLNVVIGTLTESTPYGGEAVPVDFPPHSTILQYFNRCWLNGPFIWSFLAPVALMTIINLVVLLITLRTTYKVQTRNPRSQQTRHQFRGWIRKSLFLSMLLGLNWISGFFTLINDEEANLAFSYIFTILTASQGLFLFYYFCLNNPDVKTALLRKSPKKIRHWISRLYSTKSTMPLSSNAQRKASNTRSTSIASGKQPTSTKSSTTSLTVFTSMGGRLRAGSLVDLPSK